MKTDKEIKKLFKIIVIKPHIIKITFLKTSEKERENTRKTELIRDKILAILYKKPEMGFNILMDLTPMGVKATVSSGSKKIWKNLASNKQIKRISIVGDPESQVQPLELTLHLVAYFLTKNKISWFTGYSEAKKWLNLK